MVRLSLILAAFCQATAPRRRRLGPRRRLLRQRTKESIPGTLVTFEMVLGPRRHRGGGRQADARILLLHRPDRSDLGHVRRVRARPRLAERRGSRADATAQTVAAVRRAGLRLGTRRIPGHQRRPHGRRGVRRVAFQEDRQEVSSTDGGRVAARRAAGGGRRARCRRRSATRSRGTAGTPTAKTHPVGQRRRPTRSGSSICSATRPSG